MLAEAARIWAQAGLGPVIGITPSQSARNTLAAGVPVSYNAAQFLGHLPGRRSARGPVPIGPGTLLVIDEASMLSGPDLADLIAYAKNRGAKIILAGDVSQLQAVENGGGMSLLAGALGYARLAEPVRFRHAWEQAASLRLRDGDTTVLAEYDQHGRIIGGDPEEMMDAAAAAYVALTGGGNDTLLMAADHALRRELNRRIRDDLITLGIVTGGPAVTIADGTRASPGDLIICTRNDHATEAGEAGRTLANGDLLRIEAITGDGLLVRRPLDAHPVTGQRRWTDRHFVFNSCKDAELGYAVTDHAAQGRTVHTGLAVITGAEDRQHAYVALSRGTEVNLAYVFTRSPKTANPVPGPRPAPELARYDRRAAPGGPAAPATPADPLAVLAGVLDRDGQQRSATQTRNQALADADHLAILHAIWAAETTPVHDRRYHDLLMGALPPGTAGNPATRPGGCGAPCVAPNWPPWTPPVSWPTQSPNGTWPIPRHRRRSRRPSPAPPWLTGGPLAAQPWSERVPRDRRPRTPGLRCPDRRADGCPHDRIGEHAAGHPQAWAINALGEVPEEPAGRLAWQKRAAAIGALAGTIRLRPPGRLDRPRTGRGGPGRPGPPGTRPWPPSARPTARTCAACPMAGCCTCATLTRSRPPGHPEYVGQELRQVRAAAWDARGGGLRAAAEGRAAAQRGDDDRAAAAHKLAAGYQALERAYRQRETVFAQTMADRADWDTATRAQRQLAVAADAELRRRHPGQYFAALRSAEPEPANAAQRAALTPDQSPGEIGQWISDLAAGHHTFADRLADRQSQTVPSEDPDYGDLGPAFPAWTSPRREPILQPPMPEIPPSPRILERATGPRRRLGSRGLT